MTPVPSATPGLQDEVTFARGIVILRSTIGVCCIVEDLSKTGSAGEGATGFWVRLVRGRGAWRRLRAWIEGKGPAVEWHEVGTFDRLRDARRAAVAAGRQARREGLA